MRAEAEEELKELKTEKEALRSALKLIEGENSHLRSAVSSPQLDKSGPPETIPDFSPTPSRSSSRIGVKSRPHSLDLASTLPLPPSPAPNGVSPQDDTTTHDELLKGSLFSPTVISPEEESQPTPRYRMVMPPAPADDIFSEASPWADIPSSRTTSPELHSSASLVAMASLR